MTEVTPQLTSKKIAWIAWKQAAQFGREVGVEEFNSWGPDFCWGSDFEKHMEALVHKIIMEAGNPNPVAMMAKEHDEEVAKKIREGWRLGDYNPDEKSHPELLPFSQLPVPVLMKAQFFRSTVVLLKNLWAGH